MVTGGEDPQLLLRFTNARRATRPGAARNSFDFPLPMVNLTITIEPRASPTRRCVATTPTSSSGSVEYAVGQVRTMPRNQIATTPTFGLPRRIFTSAR